MDTDHMCVLITQLCPTLSDPMVVEGGSVAYWLDHKLWPTLVSSQDFRKIT